MQSSKEKSFWVAYILVMFLLLGGAAFFLYTSMGVYQDARAAQRQLSVKKKRLENKAIYPEQSNVELFDQRIKQFRGEVDVLHQKLKLFQRPLDHRLPARQFPKLLSDRVVLFRDYTTSERRTILPENLYFGMARYEKGGLPPEEATGILKFQLESIEYLLRLIIDNGSDEIFAFSREETPLENMDEQSATKDPELRDMVAKYPVSVSFLTTHDGFRSFLNRVSNDREYFYIVRVLRVDNEVKQGPDTDVEQPRVFREEGTGDVLSLGFDGEFAQPSKVEQDARVVFGNEKLRVTAIIDLCRFPEKALAENQS